MSARKMNRAAREFVKEQEATSAAKSKESKTAGRKKRSRRFGEWLREKAEHIEMNGNPAAAKTFREYWSASWGVKFPGHPELPTHKSKRFPR